jgi:hypothetical protein
MVVGDRMVLSGCLNESRRSADGSKDAGRRQSIRSSEETCESRWSEGMQESGIRKEKSDGRPIDVSVLRD